MRSKEASLRAVRAWKERQRANGICIVCGKRPARKKGQGDRPPSLCRECSAVHTARSTAESLKRQERGVCVTCGKRPPREGLKTCGFHERKKQPTKPLPVRRDNRIERMAQLVDVLVRYRRIA